MLELKNNIFYVGVKDPTLRTFDIFMETEYGTTYNAYLVKGEKTALIETAHEKLLDSYISNIEEIMPVSEIDYLICNHTEPDHSGSVKKILDGGEWQRQEIFRLVNDRMETGKITIYTSNMSTDSLNVDPRTRDRIVKASVELQMPEESLRRKKAEMEQQQFLREVL